MVLNLFKILPFITINGSVLNFCFFFVSFSFLQHFLDTPISMTRVISLHTYEYFFLFLYFCFWLKPHALSDITKKPKIVYFLTKSKNHIKSKQKLNTVKRQSDITTQQQIKVKLQKWTENIQKHIQSYKFVWLSVCVYMCVYLQRVSRVTKTCCQCQWMKQNLRIKDKKNRKKTNFFLFFRVFDKCAVNSAVKLNLNVKVIHTHTHTHINLY